MDIVTTSPETTRISPTTEVSEDVQSLMKLQTEYLENEWRSPYVEILAEISHYQGSSFCCNNTDNLSAENPLFRRACEIRGIPPICVATTHRMNARPTYRFIVDLANQMIELGTSYSTESETESDNLLIEEFEFEWLRPSPSPESILHRLISWSDHPERQYLFTTDYKIPFPSEIREYSVSQRFQALFHQTWQLYTRLLTEKNLPKGIETLKFAMIIALKSKLKSPRERITDYPAVLSTFQAWTPRSEDYATVLNNWCGKGTTGFDIKVADLRARAELVHAYLDQSKETRRGLEVKIFGTDLSYAELFERYYGINPTQERESYKEITHDDKQMKERLIPRFSAIRQAILHDDPTILEEIIHKERAASLVKEVTRIPLVGRREISAEIRLEPARKIYSQLEEMLANDTWDQYYVLHAEPLFYYEFFGTYIRVFESLMRNGQLDAQSRTYATISRYFLSRFNAFTSAPPNQDKSHDHQCIGHRFPECVHDAFEFKSRGLVPSSIETMIGDQTGTSIYTARGTTNIGISAMNRYKALSMLQERPPKSAVRYYQRRIDQVIHALTGGRDYPADSSPQIHTLPVNTGHEAIAFLTDPGNTEGSSLQYNLTSISVLKSFLIMEAICSGINNPEAKSLLERVLRLNEGTLDEFRIEPHDPEYINKIRRLHDLFDIRLRIRHKSVNTNVIKHKRIAIRAALLSLPDCEDYVLTRLLLYAIARGYSARGILDALFAHGVESPRQTTPPERQLIQEVIRHILQLPPTPKSRNVRTGNLT